MEIKICRFCKGTGVIEDKDKYNEYYESICNPCEGTGKIYYNNIIYELPFNKKNKKTMSNISKKIFNIINNIDEINDK